MTNPVVAPNPVDRYQILNIRNNISTTAPLSSFTGLSVICDQPGAITRILTDTELSNSLAVLRYAGFWFPYASLGSDGESKFLACIDLMESLEYLDVRSNHDWPSEFFQAILERTTKLRYLVLHDARLNLSCLKSIRNLVDSALFELGISNCGPGRRSPITALFSAEVESLREHIRMNGHLLNIHSFIDGNDFSLSAPVGGTCSNSVLLEISKSPLANCHLPPGYTPEVIVHSFFSYIDTQPSFRVWFQVDAKSRLKVFDTWKSFTVKHDDIVAYGLVSLPVRLVRRCGHLAQVKLVDDKSQQFLVECRSLEADTCNKFPQDTIPLALSPGTIVEISHGGSHRHETLRGIGSKIKVRGTSLGFVVDHDFHKKVMLVASLTATNARLTDEYGTELDEDHHSARVTRVYFDLVRVAEQEVFVSGSFAGGFYTRFPDVPREVLQNLDSEDYSSTMTQIFCNNVECIWNPSRPLDSLDSLECVPACAKIASSAYGKLQIAPVVDMKRSALKVAYIPPDTVEEDTLDEGSEVDEWDPQDYEARKLIIDDGDKMFPAFFIRWILDDFSQLEYSETAPSPKDIARRYGRRAAVKSAAASKVFFINPEEASKKGFNPPPEQLASFAHVSHVPGEAILQPIISLEDESEVTEDRVIVKTTSVFTSLPKELLEKVSVLGRGVDVRLSRIQDAGRGVYATRTFNKNEIITLYCGHVFGEIQRKWMQRQGLGTHSKPLTQKLTYLDGVKVAFTGMYVGQLVNHSSSWVNSTFVTVDIFPYTGERVIGLKAMRHIYAGEEIYVQYGAKFWSEQCADPTDAPAINIPEADIKRQRV